MCKFEFPLMSLLYVMNGFFDALAYSHGNIFGFYLHFLHNLCACINF